MVEEAGLRGLLQKRDPSSITPEDFFRESDEVRALFSELVNAPDPSRIAILPSVSYGVGVAARNTTLRAGQNIVLLEEQFPGNVYAWRRLALERGAEVRMVGPGGERTRGRIWNQRILEAIDEATGVVALAPVHWTDGTRFDLEAIGARAREVGAAFVVDGTQSVGALPFDVQELKPDALICAGYKWLLGPYSIGVGYFGPRYLVGERSNFILVPMLAAALKLTLDWRPERIQEYTRALVLGLLSEAEELGYALEEESWRVHHIFGIRMPPGVDLAAMKQALAREGVSASLRGSALRVSPHLYNDDADVEALSRVLRRVSKG
jgi:selenocysteine lyase/cysteine desulfurase